MWKTFKLDFEKGRAAGIIDGGEALRQAVGLALAVPRYRYAIYSPNYGSELESLIGGGRAYGAAQIPGMVEDALLADPRIRAVENLTLVENGSEFRVSFAVKADSGRQEMEVSVNV